jgi:HlyD family secretion protein
MRAPTGAVVQRLSGLVWALAMLCLLVSCGGGHPPRVQGYVEGEFVYVASPLPGALQSLGVQRGSTVRAGDLLFALDSAPEQAAFEEAERRLAQARANWEDAKKGRRPSEIASIEAQLKQARAALALAERELSRQTNLVRIPGATAELEYDRARAVRDQNRERVAQLEAELKTAQLGARTDQIVAAEATVRAMEAALAKAAWDLAQKRQVAPKDGVVFDTLYREGEWVPAGRPVVVLLPPEHIKVRAFVPEPLLAQLHPGDDVDISVDGMGEALRGKIRYISPRAEFTPPVIYSQESRAKLVFMIEAVFDRMTAARLHPGQPVDVAFGGINDRSVGH